MARLTAKQRKKLPSKSFAGPGRSFPMNDKAHARNAVQLEKFCYTATKKNINARASKMGVKVSKKKGK